MIINIIKIKINKIKFKLFNVFNNSSNDMLLAVGVVGAEVAVVVEVILTLLNFSENCIDLLIISNYWQCICRFYLNFS